jgi:hypothetical protein
VKLKHCKEKITVKGKGIFQGEGGFGRILENIGLR